jgi:hypothetical protein
MSGDNPALDVYLGTQLIAKINVINDQLYWTYSPYKHRNLMLADKNEQNFLNNYAEIIIKRSKHLLEQSNYISSIDL